MNVISIGSDRKLFERGSAVSERIKKYGRLFDAMHIIVFAKKNLGFKDQQIADNIWIYPTNSSSKAGYIFDAIQIGKRIAKANELSSENSIITCQDPFESGLVGWLLKRTLHFKLHIQVHIDFFSPFYKKESFQGRLQAILGPFILRRADGIRVVSKKIQTYLIERLAIPAERIVTLSIYTSAEELQKKTPSFNLHDRYKQFNKILLIAARLVKQKNIPMALQAMETLVEKHKNLGLVIVGSGKEELALKSCVKEHVLSEHVVFESWSNDLVPYYKTADIFLMPSHYEGWGLTAVEAVVCGLPVIMTNVGCAGEFIQHDYNGIVVPVNDLTAFTNAIDTLLSDNEKRSVIAQNAKKSSALLMSKEEYLSKYKESFERMLQKEM